MWEATCLFCDVNRGVQFLSTHTVQTQADPEDPESPAVDLRVINWFACPNGHQWGVMTWFALDQPAQIVMLDSTADAAGTHHPLTWEAVAAEKRRMAAMSQIIIPGGRVQ